MSSRESSRRGSNAYSHSSLSSNGSSVTATRDLWRLRQTMHCLEKCVFYHGSLNRNAAREKMRRCKPGCYLIRDSNDPQYLFTLQQTLHFVGPCATRIAFIQGLFRFQDSTGVENGARENRGFPCVVSLIEHYASKYREMDVLALRYPVTKHDEIHEEAEEHNCFVESPHDDAAETPRRIHPELAASLAGSTQTCNSCTSHSGPTRLEYQDGQQNGHHAERVSRRANSDGAIATGFSEHGRRSTIHATDISTEMRPNDLRQSLNGLKERMESEIEKTNQPNLEEIFPGIEPLISTARRNSADRHFKKANSLDPYFTCESMMQNTLPTQQQIEKSSRRSSRKSLARSREELEAEIDRDYNFSSSLGNVKIDLDDLGAILGGTSITVANDD